MARNTYTIDLTFPFLMTLLLGYFVCINIVTFFVWGRDKQQAKRQKRRVREKTLLWLVIGGGVLGALGGQEYFRHKTIKGSFVWKLYSILVLWIILIGYILYQYSTT